MIVSGLAPPLKYGHTVIFRPDMNASRMADSCRRLEMPVFPEDKFVEAIAETVRANEDWVPPYGSGASLYIRPYNSGFLKWNHMIFNE